MLDTWIKYCVIHKIRLACLENVFLKYCILYNEHFCLYPQQSPIQISKVLLLVFNVTQNVGLTLWRRNYFFFNFSTSCV